MIPIQLTIQGLYSYQEKQTIDFTRLTAANLFGIFGSVGSGKSSILEAITFAIYGRTDRLNLSGDNRYYNMMNLKSNELLIDFIFETGKEQTAYRAMVKGKRNGKNFDDVKTLERSAYRKTNDEWIPVEAGDLEQVIGLSYDNFKRTIIIPQGQFQEFLQLGNKDRTQMMKELFNLGKYEFFYKVTSLEGKNNAQKQHIEGQLQQLGAVDPELVKTYKAQLEQLTEVLKVFNQQLQEKQKTEETLRNLQALMQKRIEVEKELKALGEKEEVFKQLEKNITRYEQAVSRFKYLFDASNELAAKQLARENKIIADRKKLEEEKTEIAELTGQIETLRPVYEKRETLKQSADELTRLLRMKALEQDLVKEEERLKNGTKVCEQTIKLVDELKKQKQQLEEQLKATKKQLPDLALLSNIKAWFIEKHSLDKLVKENFTEQEKYQQEIAGVDQQVKELLLTPLFVDLEDTVVDEFLQQKVTTLKEQQKALTEKENHLHVKAQLKAYSEGLDEGQPCPLCGSVHHPEVYKADDFQEALTAINKEKTNIEQQQELLSAASNQLAQFGQQRQLLVRQHEQLTTKGKTQLEQQEAHAKKFVWKKYSDEAELTNAFTDAERLQKEVTKQETDLEKHNQQLDKEEKNKERFQAEVDKIKNSMIVHQTELKTLGEQLQLIDAKQYRETQIMLIEDEKNKLLTEYTRIEKEYTEKNTLLTVRTKACDTLAGSLAANEKEQEHDKQAQLKLQSQLSEQLQQSVFQSLDEVKQVLAAPIAVEAGKKQLTQFSETLVRARSQAEEIDKQIGDQTYNAEVHQKLVEELTALRSQITEKNQEQGRVSELLKKLEKDLESRATLIKEQEQLQLRAENIKTMKSLFKASGFVNYISSVYLQNLCNAANDRFFQLTRQKLSLEITPDNNFQVRDFMNGGKVRSVKTLSGGQTFQAALSLALALADNIQKITESNQNFFFLDEGFGSLDKESLGVVFDTLKSLRKENRIVGVISHVEEMQQEIDVHLRIENHEESGSKVLASWSCQ